MFVPFSNPDLTEAETQAVLECLRSTKISFGPKGLEFERKIREYVGSRFAVAVNGGTAGLHLAVRALGIGQGDEVITTPFSFIASANCLLYERAVPVFVDIEPETLTIDPDQIESRITPRTKAILAVDIFGHPARWEGLEEIARRRGLRLIDDACEAFGSERGGRKAGTFGNCGVFAFYPNKQLTTAEGGVIVTDDPQIASLCRSMCNQGRDSDDEWLIHDRLGYNYRIRDLHCALGIAQLTRVEEILSKRERIARMYEERLAGHPDLLLPTFEPTVKISWFAYVVRLGSRFTRIQRDRIIQTLKEKEIVCRNNFPPIHLQPLYVKMFGYQRGQFPVCEAASDRTIALPFFPGLRPDEIDYVAEQLIRRLDEV